MGLLALDVLERSGRRAPIDLARRDALPTRDTTLGAHGRTRVDTTVVCNAYLSANDRMVPDARASGYTGLG